MSHIPFIEHETPEDLTARMLRRKSIQEVEDIASIEGVWSSPHHDLIIDRNFLYTYGYTIDEWFEASQRVRVKRAVDKIQKGLTLFNTSLQKSIKANYSLNNSCPKNSLNKPQP